MTVAPSGFKSPQVPDLALKASPTSIQGMWEAFGCSLVRAREPGNLTRLPRTHKPRHTTRPHRYDSPWLGGGGAGRNFHILRICYNMRHRSHPPQIRTSDQVFLLRHTLRIPQYPLLPRLPIQEAPYIRTFKLRTFKDVNTQLVPARDQSLCHQGRVWVKLQLALHLLLLTVLQLYHLPPPLPPPVSNSSCPFTPCQPPHASCGTAGIFLQLVAERDVKIQGMIRIWCAIIGLKIKAGHVSRKWQPRS